MATVGEAISLDEFLTWPDEKPYREFVDGRIEVKVSPASLHAIIQVKLSRAIDDYATDRGCGSVFAELRCVYDGRSVVPDLVYLRRENVRLDERTGRFSNQPAGVPDLMVEILSPEQSRALPRAKLLHATANGCSLGWLIDPERDEVEVVRPEGAREILRPGDVLRGEPVLPGFALAVSDIFNWLIP